MLIVVSWLVIVLTFLPESVDLFTLTFLPESVDLFTSLEGLSAGFTEGFTFTELLGWMGLF
jgi:hypothetical protein